MKVCVWGEDDDKSFANTYKTRKHNTIHIVIQCAPNTDNPAVRIDALPANTYCNTLSSTTALAGVLWGVSIAWYDHNKFF